ncbi:multisubunit sodium/proton antiporter MrpE subunit [Desulfobotulus alkaliphilus]|uniref:Multisubunit sodium/proton antiporter MrpE subunit n=1 Tax=Desulfobotulus alkaliphilus TaxID=622671 RepID=A0A562S6M2_9BACT|nr:Na+/H+ antiporter subunit E [Desulfobotulus alkaliphilus]TWI76848.1 multisubunit sodium/proton antiporter MrpE subunit [Desulfobotulus alkaliphilus]
MIPTDSPPKTGKGPTLLLTWCVLMLTWILLSGMFDLFHLGLGAISAAIVAWFSHDLLFPNGIKGHSPALWYRFFIYVCWLLWQILLSGIHVLKLVYHPGLKKKIDPHIIQFHTRIQNETGRVTFGNSITLTPGTITLSISSPGRFTVHALDKQSSESLPGEMEQRIARTFGE